MSGSFTSALSALSNALTNVTSTALPDTRVRLAALNPSVVYGISSPTNLLTPLVATNGLLFPYSPSIQFSQEVTYNATAMVHTDTDYEGYVRTPSVTIGLTGKFTVQNTQEGQDALAAIHFLRVASKMYFGEFATVNGAAGVAAPNSGLPPPMLVLNGYGQYMFNNLRCILKSHSYSYEDGTDTVPVYTPAGALAARLPPLFTLTLSLVVQQTPQVMRKTFDIEAFRTGALIAGGGGFI